MFSSSGLLVLLLLLIIIFSAFCKSAIFTNHRFTIPCFNGPLLVLQFLVFTTPRFTSFRFTRSQYKQQKRGCQFVIFKCFFLRDRFFLRSLRIFLILFRKCSVTFH